MGKRIRVATGRSAMRLAMLGSLEPEFERSELLLLTSWMTRTQFFGGLLLKPWRGCPSTIRLRRMVPLPETSSGRIDLLGRGIITS
jgi:hypothetical protein